VRASAEHSALRGKAVEVSKAVEAMAGADVVAVLGNRKQHGHIEWPLAHVALGHHPERGEDLVEDDGLGVLCLMRFASSTFAPKIASPSARHFASKSSSVTSAPGWASG